MGQMYNDDIELKKVFVNRQKRLFNNILGHLEEAKVKGIMSEESIQQFRNHYNEIVYEDAKKAYFEYKLKQKHIYNYADDLFSKF